MLWEGWLSSGRVWGFFGEEQAFWVRAEIFWRRGGFQEGGKDHGLPMVKTMAGAHPPDFPESS